MAHTDTVKAYGWTAQPRKVETLLSDAKNTSSPASVLISSIELPSSHIARSALQYAKTELPIETFNHSMRVFYYGMAIVKEQFPSWASPTYNETYFLTALLHDIGTTPKNMPATQLSFEFYGGMLSLEYLRSNGSPISQAESVAEAVFRHQDLGETGTLTAIGALIQLATIFDNMGGNPELVHPETISDVVEHYPRLKWSGCFAKTIRKENGLKPWAHTTHLGESDFPDGVEGNKLMNAYEQ